MLQNLGNTKETYYEWVWNLTNRNKSEFSAEKIPLSISYRSDKDKFYSLDLQKIPSHLEKNTLRTVIIDLDNFIFTNVCLKIFAHYPRKLFRTLPIYTIESLDAIDDEKVWFDLIKISNMIAIRRRDTYREPCNMDWKNYDKYILDSLAKSVGCKPPYWKIDNTKMALCDTKEKMKKSFDSTDF